MVGLPCPSLGVHRLLFRRASYHEQTSTYAFCMNKLAAVSLVYVSFEPGPVCSRCPEGYVRLDMCPKGRHAAEQHRAFRVSN